MYIGNNIPKISIIVITYNQENLIGRALESILIQKEWVYEIIIGDDCSTDNNWDVIIQYTQKYPDLIKPYRNSTNLGIFENMESLYSKPTGDMVFWIAGDDTFCDGLFAKAIEIIFQKDIDYKNELFCIYFDHKRNYSDGSSYIYSNKMILKNYSPISLSIRRLINNNSIGFSVNIQKKMFPVRKDIGIYADGLIDIQIQMFSTHNYYAPFVGKIYYQGIGVSSKTYNVDHLKSMQQFRQELRSYVDFTPKDEYFMRFCEERALVRISWKQSLKILIFYIKSIDIKLGLKGLQLSKIFFILNRKNYKS